ncbi:MAG: hypothetical protein KAX38_03480 [Candidatus Krumholzibacteria bacterium]|nr:hypothetical protein [Candidatus Krumholzibacteria bacterium]
MGKLPVNFPEEIANFIPKLSSYCLSPAESLCTTSLMVGELLWTIEGEKSCDG